VDPTRAYRLWRARVHFVESVAWRPRVDRLEGSAHDAGELDFLLAQAQALIDNDVKGVPAMGLLLVMDALVSFPHHELRY